ncbi:uncharacterized protein LOC134260705 [Saccostrea cucullata]|uniref:uncharacterized protein LOC134260705 n=1 Tax=Saccostrea cuccullata TaxID=36930 RepID=UPI002ED208FA
MLVYKYEKCQKIGKLLGWIAANLLTLASKKEIWKLFICICFSIIVSQAEGCESGARVVDEIKILHPSAICNTQLENAISCNGSLSSVCLYSVPNDTHAWGCAPDICLNGNVCPEWNILPNGSYVVQGGRGNCSGCPPFYHLSQLLNREFEECYNSSQKYYPRSTVAQTTESTVAPTTERTGAPTTERTGAPTTERTGAPTTKNMQALSTGGIVGIVISLLAVIGASSLVGICIWKKRQVYRNPPTPDREEETRMTEPLQNGSNGSTANGEDTRIRVDQS